jgi:hypothetical protein
MYQYILVHTCMYQYVRDTYQLHTAFNTPCTSLYLAMVQGSTCSNTTYQGKACYRALQDILPCTFLYRLVQVYRILRRWPYNAHRGSMNLIHSSSYMFYGSLWDILLESYTPGQVGTRQYIPPCAIACFSLVCCIAVCTPLYHIKLDPALSRWRQNRSRVIAVHSKYIRVCTSTYQYVRVHTAMYWHILIYAYIPVQTRMYAYVRVHTRTEQLECIQKKCKQISNPRSSAYFSQSVPLHYGSTDLNAGYMLGCHQCIYFLPLPSVSTMAKVQDVTRWARNIRQFNDQHTWTQLSHLPLGYMLVRPIGELSVLEQCQWRALANAMLGLCEMLVVQVHGNCTWFLNFRRPG